METPVPLIATKLYMPPPQPNLVSRPRLYRLLEEGLHTKLTLVSAPAGFGKTTVISDWLHRQDLPVGWFSVDESDNDALQFLAYLIAALQQVFPDLSSAALYMLQSPKPPSMELLLSNLVNDIDSIPQEFLLVLDDYHLIKSKWVHRFIEEILEHLPRRMHLVVVTRSDPPIILARLRSQNQLTEVRAQNLAFTQEETASFFHRTLHMEVHRTDLNLLESRTEGWIAGLQLAALSMREEPDISRFIRNFKADHRYIADYLLEEVLAHQPEETRAFLLQTSVLDRLSGSLCDAVTGRKDSGQLLARLEKENLFLFPLDNNRQWFRYHRLFADLLRQRLRQEAEEMVPELHRRASTWHKSHGDLAEAVEHALQAADPHRAADLIEQVAEDTVKHSHFATFLRWTDALPEEYIETRPRLCVFHAMAMLYSGQPLTEAEAHVARLEAAAPRGAATGELAAFRGLVAALQGKGIESARLAERALDLMPQHSTFLHSVIAGIRGLGYLYSGDLDSAEAALEEAADIGLKSGNIMNAVLARCHLAELTFLAGDLHQAKTHYDLALNIATDSRNRHLPVAGVALMGLGNVYLEWYDLRQAEDYLREGIELTERWALIGTLHGYLYLARLNQTRGDLAKAEELLRKARQVAVNFDATEMDDRLVDLFQVRLWIEQGELQKARQWFTGHSLTLQSGDVQGVLPERHSLWWKYLVAIENLTLAKLYLNQNEPKQALELLAAIPERTEREKQIWLRIETLILEVLASDACGEKAHALTSLGQVLSLAEPGGFVRLFVIEGPPMQRFLEEILTQDSRTSRRGFSRTYVQKLLTILKTAQKIENSATPPTESLSDRELEVLHLLAAGLSNREIAEKLYVSLNTIRTHTKNIYDKLKVHNRTKAAARGKALGLI